VTLPLRTIYLVSECDRHDGDEEAKEQLQLPKAVLVDEQEGEGVEYRDDDPRPHWQAENNRR
jgi:hypothetical protein